jgi:hypothetical protein
MMMPFQEVVRLKVERLKSSGKRIDEIDKQIKRLEPRLTHDEAVFIVKKYEDC